MATSNEMQPSVHPISRVLRFASSGQSDRDQLATQSQLLKHIARGFLLCARTSPLSDRVSSTMQIVPCRHQRARTINANTFLEILIKGVRVACFQH